MSVRLSLRHWLGVILAAILTAILGVAVPCAAAAAPPGHDFRISGVAVSTRDGAPVPYCRISASLVPANQVGTARNPAPRGPGTANGGRPMGGPPGNRGGGGTVNQTPQTTADESGRFTLEVPRAGAWMLTAAARGFRGQNYDEHDGFYSAVVLTETAPTFSLNFRMVPDSVLTGLIFDEAGEPVVQAQVTAELIPAPTPGVSSNADVERPRPAGFAQTDDRGRYEIGSLAPGRYRLRVQATPWYAAGHINGDNFRAGGLLQPNTPATTSLDPPLDFVYPVTWFPGTDNDQEAQVLTLGPGEERQADFHLTAIPSVHLRIPRTDTANVQPAENGRGRQQQQVRQQVTISRVSGERQAFEQGFNGNDWDFGGLTPGTYEVRLPGPDGRPGGGEVRQIEVRSGGQTVVTLDSAKTLVPVTIRIEGVPDLDVQTIEFVDTQTGNRITSNPPFRGRRGPRGDDDEDPDDDPPQNAARTVMLPPHQYEVYVGTGASEYLTGMAATGASVVGRSVTVGGPAALTLHLATGRAQVEGVAKLQGRPSEGAMVLLVPVTLGQPGDLSAVLRDETNTDGTFLISGATPGRYILVAIDHGWDVDWRSPGTLARYLMHGVPVELRSGAKVHEELEAAEK